jgi:hypothetical protein
MGLRDIHELDECLRELDWRGYADACLTHDYEESVVVHAPDLAAAGG